MKKYTRIIVAIILSLIFVLPAYAHSNTNSTFLNDSNQTQVWWLINAARGNGEFSYEFELAPSAAQREAGTHGQRGIVEGRNGIVRVFHRTAAGTYTETTNSVAMALFARNFRLLTLPEYNRVYTVPDFPDWIELAESTTYEFFPLVTHETLANAADPFSKNLRSSNPENAMMFAFDGDVMSAVQFTDHNGNNVFKKISNLQPALSGVTLTNRSTKTYLWWIIDAARGNGEFSFDFEFEDGTSGRMTGSYGVIRAFDEANNEVPDSPALTVFGERFALLTQLHHNHNNPIDGVRPYEPPFPEWLGLTDNGVGFVNGNYELFPLVTQETLANAANPFEMNLLSPDPTRQHAMLFIYDGGVMSAVQFRDPATDSYVFMRISSLRNYVGEFATPPVNDTVSDWAQNSVRSAIERGFVPVGTQNNLSNVLTRQEFCQMAVMWAEYVFGSPISAIVAEHGIAERMNHTFSDTTDSYVLAAYKLGIINGTTAPADGVPGIFDPYGLLNRQQAATIIMNVSRLLGANVYNIHAPGFVDMDIVPLWATAGIYFVYGNNIMSGVDDNRFNPLGYLTREMGIVTFDNININELLNR